MKIGRVDLTVVELPLIRPFVTSSSRRTHLRHIVIEAHGEGYSWLGRIRQPGRPILLPRNYRDVLAHSQGLPDSGGPRPGMGDNRPVRIAGYERVKGNNFAKAGLEMAAWDLLSQAQDRSRSTGPWEAPAARSFPASAWA